LLGELALRFVLDGVDLSGREALVKHCDLDYQIVSVMDRLRRSVATLWRCPSSAAGDQERSATEYAEQHNQAEYR
jgi:hypothetical protein